MKWKTKNSTLSESPQSNWKIVERDKTDTYNTQIHDRSLSWLGTSKWSCKYFSRMSEMTNLIYNLVNSVINKAKDYLGNKMLIWTLKETEFDQFVM